MSQLYFSSSQTVDQSQFCCGNLSLGEGLWKDSVKNGFPPIFVYGYIDRLECIYEWRKIEWLLMFCNDPENILVHRSAGGLLDAWAEGRVEGGWCGGRVGGGGGGWMGGLGGCPK